jgi:alpha-1,6-mannosyltransferase
MPLQLSICSFIIDIYLHEGISNVLQATLVTGSFCVLRAAVEGSFGQPAGAAFLLITALQFHLPFYASRPLPNTFALVPANVAHAYWLHGRHPQRAIALLAFTVVRYCLQNPASFLTTLLATTSLFGDLLQVVLRCDVLPWAGIVGLQMLLSQKVDLKRGLTAGAIAAFLSMAVTVLVDSVFWGRWLWPEGEVLWFNTAENRCKCDQAAPLLVLEALPG